MSDDEFEPDSEAEPEPEQDPEPDIDDFSPTESVEDAEGEGTGEFLNRKTGEYAPQTVVYSLLLLITGIGFAAGALIAGGLISGTLCGFEVMSMFTADLTGIDADGGDDIMEMAEEQFATCMQRSIFSPIPLLSALFGGIVGAYPSYKIAKMVSGGKHLRSLI